MRRVFVRYALIAVCGSVFFSCSPKTAGIALDTEAISAEALISRVRKQSDKLRSLQGKGTVSFDSPEMAGTAWFTSVMKRPDSLLVHLEGPFGISVGTLFLSREHYVVYNSLENRVITGVPSARSIRGVIPFDLTYDQLVDAFAGVFAIPFEQGTPGTYRIDDGRFFLSDTCDTTICDYWIDPEFLLVTKFSRRDFKDRTIIEASATSITQDGDVVAPRRIMIRFPNDNRQISIVYSSMSLNSSDLSFAFSIPQSAETTVR